MTNGYQLWAVGQAAAYHLGSASAKKSGQRLFSSCIAEHYFRSRFYYLRKFYGWPLAAFTEMSELALLSVRAVLNGVRRRASNGGLAARMSGPFFSLPEPVELGGGEITVLRRRQDAFAGSSDSVQ
jgi:hypothetical protein